MASITSGSGPDRSAPSCRRCGDGAFFLVTADMNVAVIGTTVGKPWINTGRHGKRNDRLVPGKEFVEIHVA